MNNLVRVTVFLFACLQVITLAAGDVGTATAYDPPYTPTRCNGNRADQFPLENKFVAVSEALWDNSAACGRRYRLKCLSGRNKHCKAVTIDNKVVDLCKKKPCPSNLVMARDAFAAISKSPRAKINIEYIEI